MRKPLYIVLPLAALGALGAYAYYAQRADAPADAAATPAAKGGAQAITVEAFTVAPMRVEEDLVAVGTLRSNESVVVRPEVSGRIVALNFAEGGQVRKGQLLIQLDASVAEAELQQTKANLRHAKTNYDRTVELQKSNFVSAAARDQALNTLKVEEATVALAEARLAKMHIDAPFGGVIGIRQVSVGDYVKEGQDLVSLEDTSSFKVDFRVPEIFIAALQRGQSVEVTSDALQNKRFSATIDAIDPLVDQSGRAIVLRARLQNAGGDLRPGMFVQTRVILSQRENALMIPEEAVIPVGAVFQVYRVNQGKAEQIEVETGLRRNGRVEIVRGLQAGDRVVTAGHLKLRPGATVQIANDTPPDATQPAQAKTPANAS